MILYVTNVLVRSVVAFQKMQTFECTTNALVSLVETFTVKTKMGLGDVICMFTSQ